MAASPPSLMVFIGDRWHAVTNDGRTSCALGIPNGAERVPLEFKVNDQWCWSCAESTTSPLMEGTS
jgi:hypothetical protein